MTTRSSERLYCTHDPGSAPLARRWARRIVGRVWMYPGGLTENLALCVDELTTNVIRHVPHQVGGSARGLLVTLTPLDDAVRLEVHDAGNGLPVLRQASEDDEGGRGLLLVDALSREWGAFPRVPLGKVVWCVVALQP